MAASVRHFTVGVIMTPFMMYKLSESVCEKMPRSVAYRVSDSLMDLYFLSSTQARKTVENNLQLVFKKRTNNIDKYARDVFRNFGRSMVDFFQMNRLGRNFLTENVKVRGLRNLKKALYHQRGGIILTAHVGNWELGAAVLSRLGYPSLTVALPHNDPDVNEYFNSKRALHGLEVVPVGSAFRRCLQRLKQNKLVSIVADHDFSGRGEMVSFLGCETSIPKGPAVMSVRTGAPIIPAFMVRNDNDQYVLTIGEPILPPTEMTSEHRIEPSLLKGFVQRYSSALEAQIVQNPSQWLMFRKICTQ